jgi:hypothetical protein
MACTGKRISRCAHVSPDWLKLRRRIISGGVTGAYRIVVAVLPARPPGQLLSLRPSPHGPERSSFPGGVPEMTERLITPPVPAQLSYDHDMAVAHAILANAPSEAAMRIGSVLLIIWLIIGAVAAGQRHYYNGSANCVKAGTIIVTILAGPLNYVGANPKVSC